MVTVSESEPDDVDEFADVELIDNLPAEVIPQEAPPDVGGLIS
jgi:hypothetical protein